VVSVQYVDATDNELFVVCIRETK